MYSPGEAIRLALYVVVELRLVGLQSWRATGWVTQPRLFTWNESMEGGERVVFETIHGLSLLELL